MSITIERQAPPAPDQRPTDAELYRIVHGAPDEPDEIIYPHAHGTLFTNRAERASATQAWKDEDQVSYPNDAAASLARTEAMLRLRLNMGEKERASATHDLVALHSDRLPTFKLEYSPKSESTAATTPLAPEKYDEPTGAYNVIEEPATPQEKARPARRRIRFPLRRLINHAYKARHTAKH